MPTTTTTLAREPVPERDQVVDVSSDAWHDGVRARVENLETAAAWAAGAPSDRTEAELLAASLELYRWLGVTPPPF